MNVFLKYIKSSLIGYIFINLLCKSVYAQPITIAYASVSTNFQNIQLGATAIDPIPLYPREYIFFRADSKNVYKEIGRSVNYFYTDVNVAPDKQVYCYKVAYLAASDGSQSPLSQPFCSILLSSKNATSIEWTSFIPLPNAKPVEYWIDFINSNGTINHFVSNPTTNLSINVYDIPEINTEIETYGKATLRIRAIQKTTFSQESLLITDSPLTIYSNPVTIYPRPVVYLPTAFSPDGNILNNIFLAKGQNIVEFSMIIYNKWANVVFESSDINLGWNGNLSDETTPCPTGDYVYKIIGKDNFGQIFEKTGSVLLLR
jgi:gliding motility-associated-like protein